jgi:uncharacterized damage-inducible protein DinB
MSTTSSTTLTTEHRDLLKALAAHRGFLCFTAQGLTEVQLRAMPTASQLSVGKLLKHVAETEASWVAFILEGPKPMAGSQAAWEASWTVSDEDTLQSLLAAYEAVARRTDDLIASGLDLDASQPLPVAPWFPEGGRWTARRALLHIVAETAQHAGHADIIRETIDGQKTMG